MRVRWSSYQQWSAAFWCVCAFGLLSALSLLVPPMQSPDENAHLMRAEMLSHGQWRLQPAPEGTPAQLAGLGGWVDKNLALYSNAFMAVVVNSDGALPAQVRNNTPEWGWAHSEVFYPAPGTGYYFPLVYFPQALALWTGRTVGLGVAKSYQLARSCSLLVICLLVAMAWIRLRPNPAVIAIATLPMCLFQAVSPTLDGITTAMALLAISDFRVCADPLSHASERDPPWSLYACLFLLVTSRVHLLPLLLMPIFLAWKRRSQAAWISTCLLILLSMAWIGFAVASTTDVRVVREHSTGDLVRMYASHPQEFFLMLWHTLQHHELPGFYVRSFIGILGWLDVPLKNGYYQIIGIGVLLSATASLSWRRGPVALPSRLVLLVAAITSSLLVFLALALTWNPYSAPIIEGVQGRYFIVPSLMVGYALSDPEPYQACTRRPWAFWLAALVAMFSVAALVQALVDRYHFGTDIATRALRALH